MARTVTMADVARAVGVSPMTVSNVVNGRGGVSQSVRDAVLEQIHVSGYRMNAAARRLRSGRAGVIGLAVPELDRPYYAQIAAVVAQEARAHGLRLAVEETQAGAEGELSALRLSQDLQYDGLILASVGADFAQLSGLNSHGSKPFPLVLLGERASPEGMDHITLPNVEGTRAAVAHLAARGAQRIAFVGGPAGPEVSIRSLRLDGYHDGLVDAGLNGLDCYRTGMLQVDVPEITLQAGRSAGWQIADMVLRSHAERNPELAPEAIVAITDTVAMGVLRGLADRDVAVPEQMMIIGFDGVEHTEFSTPSLSTVCPDHGWIARKAMNMLVARIADPPREGSVETAPFDVVIRESSGGSAA